MILIFEANLRSGGGEIYYYHLYYKKAAKNKVLIYRRQPYCTAYKDKVKLLQKLLLIKVHFE